MKYMLDTNMCIFAQNKKNPQRRERVLAQIEKHLQDGLAISSVTFAEMEYGVQNSEYVDRNELALMKFVSIFDILPFDSKAAVQYGIIYADLKRKGTLIGTMDTLIAAHAKAEGLVVVTNNIREFKRIEGLIIEDWSL